MRRAWPILLALLIGVPLAAIHLLDPRWVPLAVAVAVGLLARVPALNGRVAPLLESCRHPSPRALRWTTLAVGALSTAYFIFTAFHQHRDLFPRLHDEHSYLIQSRMIAVGHLWEPQHPLADFFDNFYMLARPVYAPIYFPGTALLNAPFVCLGLPYWTMPVLASGLVVGLTYLLITLMIDGLAGLTAAALVISAWGLREFSTILMAQAPMALFALLMVGAWLAWRREHRARWAAAIGACMGWAAIIRPVDALAFALPIAFAMALEARTLPARRCFFAASTLLLAASPFLALQAAFDRGTTGSPWRTPYSQYLHQDQPGSEFGFHSFHADARPSAPLPQKQQYFEQYRLKEIQAHSLANFLEDLKLRAQLMVLATLPAGILAVLFFAAPFGLTDRPRLVFFLAAPLFLLLYAFNPFFLVHYPVPLIPVMAFGVVLAVHVLSRAGSSAGPDPHTSTFLTLIVLALCASALPELRPDVRDGTVPAMPLTALVHRQLASQVQTPAVVLFRFRPTDNPVEEPAYTDDVAWPDDSPVIRAHDLGPRNIEIARYYARLQPERHFYLLDRQENAGRQTLVLHPLGDAKEYLSKLEASTAANGKKN
ncbi:MAG TPA: hypothetical protein VG269_06125 [Tepidisphaeraceae bacterium]|jgi:hypothetical protein|nr:hypothetical protein [Tepidisphaeraceae bacterium]